MKIGSILLALLLCGTISARALSSDKIHLEKIVGGVWYGAAGTVPNTLLQADIDVAPGSVRTGADGSVYGSTALGAKFRIGPSSEVQLIGMKEDLPCGLRQAIVLKLTKGKITTFNVRGASGYEIQMPGGRVCIPVALCVLCMHEDAAHVYVARGQVTLYPRQGPYRVGGLQMMARPTIAILNSDGLLQTEALTHADPATASCLSSGMSPEIAAHIQEGSPNPANLIANPPVSEMQ